MQNVGFLPICLSVSPRSAEVELLEGQRAERAHGEAAHRRVHGEERQRQELPLKDLGC